MRNWCLLACLLVGCFSDGWGDGGGGGGGGGDDDDPRPDACAALTCEAVGATCGEVADGCGGMIDCGGCAAPAICGGQGVENVCAIPTAERTCAGAWCFESPAPIPYAPTAMFAVSPTDAWAIGARGAVMHWDGAIWKSVPANTTADLHDIWMASATDGWIVGTGGTIRRWNGTTWATVASGTTANLRGVHGTSATNVLVVGTAVSRKWNGSQFSNLTLTTPPDLKDVTVNGSTTWAIGSGRIWRLDATQWTSVLGSVDELSGIASAGGKTYAIGRDYDFFDDDELIFRLDGAAWTSVEHPGDPTWTSIFTDGGQIFGASDESMIDLSNFARVLGPPGYARTTTGAGGARFSATTGGQLWHHTGAWVADGFGKRYDLTEATVIDGALWFADASGLVYEWRGGPISRRVSTTGITGIAATARDDVWVTDASSAYHYDGVSWQQSAGPPFGSRGLVFAGTELLSFGDYVYRRSDPFWTKETIPTGSDVELVAAAVHGTDVYAVGYNTFGSTKVAHVIKRVNGTWTELPLPDTEALCGIAVIGPDDIWAVGHDGKSYPEVPTGKVSHWNGATWTTITRPGSQQLCAVAVVNGEVWVGGHDLHRRAANGLWTIERPLATGTITQLRQVGDELWATGSHGTVIRRAL
ncbi:MAG TPA: hypothetical protein VIU61_28480 [Kofleriaceae bacterium]